MPIYNTAGRYRYLFTGICILVRTERNDLISREKKPSTPVPVPVVRPVMNFVSNNSIRVNFILLRKIFPQRVKGQLWPYKVLEKFW
jgi:hypothetical protein